jgi:hypothetical protein
MDPQDLLYSNSFVQKNVISPQELEESQKNYGRFREYIGNREVETNEYVDEDMKESDPFNINKSLQEPYPTNLKKNHYPLFDTYTQDIVKTRYQKEKISKISINSTDRNKTLFLYPNNFSIPFNKVYTNIQEIRITDICMPNQIPPVTNYNNALAWQYASKALLDSNLCDDNIIPVPSSRNIILYSSLPNAVSTIGIENSNYLTYQSFIPEGYYTTKTLEKAISTVVSRIVHGMTYINFYEMSIGKTQLTDIHPFAKPFEEPYYSTQEGLNTPHLIRFSINPTNHNVFAVNRMEELEVVAIQCFEQGTVAGDLPEYDIFNPYVSGTATSFDSNYIYVTVKKFKKSSAQWYGAPDNTINAFPLVFTGLTGEVGGIPTDFLNYTEFFDENIYVENGYALNQLYSISTYHLYDTIVFTDKFSNTHTYLRFALKLSATNINGRRTLGRNGWVIMPKSNTTIIYNELLGTAITTGQTDGGYYGEPILKQYENPPYMGRALLFRFIYDLTNNGQFVDFEIETANVKKRSILDMLVFPVSSTQKETQVLSTKPRFTFIQSNLDGIEIQTDLLELLNQGLPFFYRTPIRRMKLQMVNGEYYFMSHDFLFIRIAPLNSPITYTNIDVAIDNVNQQINQNYVNDAYFNVGIGTDFQCLPSTSRTQNAISKNYSNLFGKILTSSIPNNIETNMMVNSVFAQLYNQPLDELNGIQIQILTPDMILYSLGRDFSFTIEIIETMDILKETNIDTKRDNVITTGYKRY